MIIWDGLILPFVVEPAKHLRRLVREPKYLSYSLLATRYALTPRYQARTVTVGGRTFQVPDVPSFLSTYREIFVDEIYRIEPSAKPLRILDLGANVGVSVLYYKDLFPDARITAYEADPVIFGYLEKNVGLQGAQGVELVQAAVWHEEGVLNFQREGSDGGRVDSGANGATVAVPAVDIRSILAQGPYDIIKMDIEGAEGEVVPCCRGLLDQTRYVFIEYHSVPQRPQQLDAILATLREAGFRHYLESVHHVRTPFLGLPMYGGFEMQLTIFAWREQGV